MPDSWSYSVCDQDREGDTGRAGRGGVGGEAGSLPLPFHSVQGLKPRGATAHI